MKTNYMFILLIIGLFLGGPLLATNVLADRDEYYEKEHDEEYERKERGYERYGEFLPPVDDPVYEKECSDCHFLYQPGLLPAASWKKIMSSTQEHFGEDLFLEERPLRNIEDYLLAHSAEKTRSEHSSKILRSLGRKTPLRITDVPYIKREHREVRTDVFKREAIKSFSNCDACHKTAAQGDYEEDNVRIPR